MKRIVQTSVLRGALALSLLAVALGATEARASTAANTRITNTATVNFKDQGGVAQTAVTAQATVTVTLVPSAVVLSSPADTAIAQGTSAALGYTITATANGPDTYNLTSVAVANNVSAVTVGLPANITLGGTTLAATANLNDTTITVPYDGTADGTVNGIAVTGHVVINGNEYTVNAIVENPGANTTTITLASGITGGSVAAGQIVGERRTFTATVPSGTVSTGGSGTQTVTTTATSQADGTKTTPQSPATVVTVNRPTLTVTKLVSVDGGATFAATGSAQPTTSLIYKIIAHNSGATPASSVAFSDTIPAYLTYVPGSAKYTTVATDAYGAANTLTDGADGDGYTFTAGAIAYGPASPGVGTVAGGGDLVLFYRATIN